MREKDDGSGEWVPGRLELFSNFDEHGNALPRPRTLLIDSVQLESGEALDQQFRKVAADEIDRFRRDQVQRMGDARAGENISDQDLLREVMNTVGKEGQLGEPIRCVVSVSMLTEGWDANTVTHILGIRAFGTQLLCEQVLGRALRRQSYDLNDDGLFNVEYADALGIPFDFTATPVVAPPAPPRETIQVKAVRPDRDHLEIRFPRVGGYRVELPKDRLTATFSEDSVLELTPELVGPSKTKNQGIVGEGVELTVEYLRDVRPSTVLFHLTRHLLYTKWRDTNDEPKLHLFGQLKRIARKWLDECLVCKEGTVPAQLMYLELADRACEKITAAITQTLVGQNQIRALLDPYNPEGSTIHVNFYTSKKLRWNTDHRFCHVNWVVCDSDWECQFANILESHPRVKRYVKNQGLGFDVPYLLGGEPKKYIPDFIVVLDLGEGRELNLVVEIKGYRREDAKVKKETMLAYWVPGVNNVGEFGQWAFAELRDKHEMESEFATIVDEACRNVDRPIDEA